MDPDDGALDLLWNKVLEDWDNPATHDAFLQGAFDRRELGIAAGRYQSQLVDESRRDLADKKLKALSMLAFQGMEATRTEPRKGLPRWVMWVAAMCCVAAVAVLTYALVI